MHIFLTAQPILESWFLPCGTKPRMNIPASANNFIDLDHWDFCKTFMFVQVQVSVISVLLYLTVCLVTEEILKMDYIKE